MSQEQDPVQNPGCEEVCDEVCLLTFWRKLCPPTELNSLNCAVIITSEIFYQKLLGGGGGGKNRFIQGGIKYTSPYNYIIVLHIYESTFSSKTHL